MNQADDKIQWLVDVLQGRKETVAFAESCTGGLLSSLWTKRPGVSKVFIGSVVAYSNSIKMKILGVKNSSLLKHGAVSEEVALEMAAGVSRSFESTWGASITGIAGPDGGTAEKPVGTVCFCLQGPGVEEVWTEHFVGRREQIQLAAAWAVIEKLVKNLDSK